MTLPARATSTFIFLSLYRASYPLFGREEGRVRTCSTLVFFFSFFLSLISKDRTVICVLLN